MKMKMLWTALAMLAAAAVVAWYFFSQPVEVNVARDPVGKNATSVRPAFPASSPPVSTGLAAGTVVPSASVQQPAAAAEPQQQQEQLAKDSEHAQAEDGRAGKLSPAAIEAIREMRQPAPGEGQVIEHPDGTLEMSLDRRYRAVPVATLGEDGSVHVDYHGEAQVPATEGR